MSKLLRRKVLERDNFMCTKCKSSSVTRLHVHHILPRINGGSDDLTNLVTLCGRCHKTLEPNQYEGTERILVHADKYLLEDIDKIRGVVERHIAIRLLVKDYIRQYPQTCTSLIGNYAYIEETKNNKKPLVTALDT